MEYKEWHDAEGAFHSQRRIYFSAANVNKVMSLHELVKMAADIAVEDYRTRGMSREFLKEHGVAILVSRNSFRIHKIPEENRVIEMSTWEEKPEALQLVRCYNISDLDGNILVSAKSTWIVMDLNGRKIMPTKNFTLRAMPQIQTESDCLKPAKISVDENGFELLDSRKIKFSDIDTNGHTTNSRYAAFVEDALGEEFRKKTPRDFRLNYSKEVMLGDELFIYGKTDSENSRLTLVGKTKDFTSFEAELFY